MAISLFQIILYDREHSGPDEPMPYRCIMSVNKLKSKARQVACKNNENKTLKPQGQKYLNLPT